MPTMKVVEVPREKIIAILNIILSKENGSEVFIPCSSKKEQQDTHTCIVRELQVMSQIDSKDSSSITHRAIFRDKRFWIQLTKVSPALNSIFIKDTDGTISKQSI